MFKNCERKKNLGFITKIRDFGNFVVFWSKVNPPGLVVINFGFNAFLLSLSQIWKIQTKKTVRFNDKPISKLISLFG